MSQRDNMKETKQYRKSEWAVYEMEYSLESRLNQFGANIKIGINFKK